MSGCNYTRAWTSPCGKPVADPIYGLPPMTKCIDHVDKTCRCGKPATGECEATMGPLCCGEPLCEKCPCSMRT